MSTIIEYYEVKYDSGFSVYEPSTCACFLTRSAAEEYAKLDRFRYVDKNKKRMVVYDTVKELELQKQADLRESALKKLTIEERKALGII